MPIAESPTQLSSRLSMHAMRKYHLQFPQPRLRDCIEEVAGTKERVVSRVMTLFVYKH